ncbi:Antirestriction protein ArdC (ArdC) [Fructobacillus fructosus]|uniref:Antirestriction protein ArdC (ArdC) n=2 Tax=Fructobacillus fructosus TaxID=1631 RepID=A0ABN9YXI5_9LACO|nr:Antirestriction protein ArdC (ArdC) [Fructobacillus fructosus]CAK1252075.1 Antirestriction protein ArdC (ArdC) [Fructobacillus fructosus]
MPEEQFRFIEANLTEIQAAFKRYVRRIVTIPRYKANFVMNTVLFYPKGIEKLLGQKVDRYGLEGPITNYQRPAPLSQPSLHERNDMPEERSLQTLIQEKDTKEVSAHIKAGMADYLKSDQFAAFLRFSNRFSSYSTQNRLLIHRQNPQAAHVASFKKWKEMDNPVKKGAKSIRIWAPVQYKVKDKNGEVKLDEKGQEIVRKTFRLVPVFDQTQVQYPEKIVSPVKDLEGDLDKGKSSFESIMKALVEETDAKITIGQTESPEVRGFYRPDDDLIVLRAGMGEKQTIKTAIHEIAHSKLHKNDQNRYGSQDYAKNEFEAESIAYMVADKLGIDSSEYSFGYLKNWQPNEENLEALSDSFETITAVASEMIDDIDSRIEKVQVESVQHFSPLNRVRNRGKQTNSNTKNQEKSSQTRRENEPNHSKRRGPQR